MVSKVWFITGTSKGFGRVWAEAALARGDRVAATRDAIAVFRSHTSPGTRKRQGRQCSRWLTQRIPRYASSSAPAVYQ